jgi:hypothetical protein
MTTEQVALIAAAMFHAGTPESEHADVFHTASAFTNWLERNF